MSFTKIKLYALLIVITLAILGVAYTEKNEKQVEQGKKSLPTKITSKRLKFLSRRLKAKATVEILNKDTKSEEPGLIVKLKMPYKTDNYA